MDNLVTTMANYAGAGAGAGASFFMLKWAVELFFGRVDKREAAVASGTITLIAHLQTQINSLTERLEKAETELADCRDAHAIDQEELARWRGTAQGMGDAKQHAQLIVAAAAVGQREVG